MDFVLLICLFYKMPVAILSVDSENYLLKDFKDLTAVYDRVYISKTVEATLLFNKFVALGVSVEQVVETTRLDPPAEGETIEEIRERFQSVVKEVESLGGAFVIISHHDVINNWRSNYIKNEWEVL
jgi:hypothetical protein